MCVDTYKYRNVFPLIQYSITYFGNVILRSTATFDSVFQNQKALFGCCFSQSRVDAPVDDIEENVRQRKEYSGV